MKKLSENGIALLVASSAFFTAMSLLARFTMRGLPPSEVTFFRMLIGVLVCAGLFAARVEPLDLRRPGVLLTRGVLGGIAVFLYFRTIGALSAGEATLLNNTYVVFIAILSPFVLREKVTAGLALVVAVALCWIALVIRADAAGSVTGKLVGLAAAFFSALAIMTIRNLRKDHGSATIFFFFSLGGLACSFATLCDGWRVPDPSSAALLVAMGLSAAGGQLLFTQALKYTRALESSTFSQITVVFTYAGEVALWGLEVTAVSMAGAALIIGACIYLGAVLKDASEAPPAG